MEEKEDLNQGQCQHGVWGLTAWPDGLQHSQAYHPIMGLPSSPAPAPEDCHGIRLENIGHTRLDHLGKLQRDKQKSLEIMVLHF